MDFDFSQIATATDEFTGYSFSNLSGGTLPGPYSSPAELSLRAAMLSGFPEPLPIPTEENSEVQWEVAKAWDDLLAERGIVRPRTIAGIEKIADIYWLLNNLSPFILSNETLRKNRTEEVISALREKTEALIIRFLADNGF